jgi:ABC-type protease/lipase transport system fused ATPase/permease subunit
MSIIMLLDMKKVWKKYQKNHLKKLSKKQQKNNILLIINKIFKIILLIIIYNDRVKKFKI